MTKEGGQKRASQRKTWVNHHLGPLGRSDRDGRLASVHRLVRSGFLRVPFILHFQPMRKRWPGKTSRETPEK
jgi:hypothetical protein